MFQYIKLAQFEAAVTEKKVDKKLLVVVERLIDQGFDINYKLEPISSFKLNSDCLGCTALHLALEHRELEVFCSLLKYGADFTIKNDQGKTVVHQAMDRSLYRKEALWKLQGQLEHPYIDAVLQNHISTNNSVNPYNQDGLSHFHAACMTNNVKAVQFFLNNVELVNKAIDNNSKALPGYTPLHLAARYCAFEVAELLLNYGANMYAKNKEGMNPLLMTIEFSMKIKNWLKIGRRAPSEKVQKQLAIFQRISQELFNRNCAYSRLDWFDDIGFSCLHISCFARDPSSVKSLHERGYNMVHSIRADSPMWPGYTALHFAVKNCFDVAIYLLEQGADLLAKDATGTTPFDLILESCQPTYICCVILSQAAWKNITFSDNKTKLTDFVLAMDNQNTFDYFLKNIDAGVNIQLPVDSPIWPRFTPLHLALVFPKRIMDVRDLQMDIECKDHSSQTYNCIEDEGTLYFKRIETCMSLGADITIKNAEGSTPLHLAFRQQSENVVTFLLQSQKKFSNSIDKAGLSHFHIACAAQNTFSATELLSMGANINSKLPSRLPYKRIFREEERMIMRNQDVIQLQVICITSKLHLFHMSTGSTALHIAVAVQSPELMKMLLEHGADIYLTDGNGLTPLHRMLTVEKPQEFANCLELLGDLKDCTLQDGLSHLHVVCLIGNENYARKLLEHGANVEAVVMYKYSKPEYKKVSDFYLEFIDPYDEQASEPMSFLARYSGYRPLHFAVKANNPSVAKVLLEHGADLLAKNFENSTPLYNAFSDEKNNCRDVFIETLKSNEALQNRIKEDTGLTVLHFLCSVRDINAIRQKLTEEIDVNVRAHEDSPLWAGCTPLHVLMKVSHVNIGEIVEILLLLLEREADVTVINVENDSPIHIAYSQDCCYTESGVRAHAFIVRMLKAQKDFGINPINSQGISHFHIACMWDVECVVEKFLMNNVDPNAPIDYFNKYLVARLEYTYKPFQGGSSPLQLALIHKSKKVFTILMKWGVDLEAVDRQGKTALHVAAAHISHDKIYFEELMKQKVNVNFENIYGLTAFGQLLGWEKIDNGIIKIFLEEGCHVNSYNTVTEEGYIAYCIPNLIDLHKPKPIFKLLLEAPDILEIDHRGRNAIHNAVSLRKNFALTSSNYTNVIDQLQQLGCDIDLQNNLGKTPLHLAIQFQNNQAIAGLLEVGADINVLDNENKSAFAYIEEWSRNDDYESIMAIFLINVYQYQLCGLYVNVCNEIMYYENMKDRHFKNSFLKENQMELNRMEEQRLDKPSITLRDFLSETGAVTAYPHMIAEKRQAIDEFFKLKKDMLRENFELLSGLLFMQYRKACKRVDLLEKALASLDILTDYNLPYLCSVFIMKFLSNRDLEHLVASTNLDSAGSK